MSFIYINIHNTFQIRTVILLRSFVLVVLVVKQPIQKSGTRCIRVTYLCAKDMVLTRNASYFKLLFVYNKTLKS